jgi:hypothetical protein
MLALLAMIACTPVAAPGSIASPEAAATPSPGSALPMSTAIPATVVMAPEVEEVTMTPQPADQEVATLAKADLAERLTIPVEQIDLLEVRAVTWPDSSLSCPQPGMMYAQVQQQGLLIRLGAAGEMYFYHSGPDQKPFLCEQLSQILSTATPKVDELVPPPDSEID